MKYILDTDIGSDVDDAMALVQLLGSGEDLIGVTTAYGPTELRARIAKHYLALMSAKVPVFAGERNPMSGKEVWLSGREGKTLPDLGEIQFEDSTAIDFLSETLRESNERVTIFCIAPLTNIGTLLEREPSIASKIKQLVIMGGNFTAMTPEHNFSSDSEAASIVMDSGIDMTLVGLDATRQLRLLDTQVEQIANAGGAGQTLATEILDWWDYWGTTWGVPHDSIAISAAFRPELFDLSDLGSVEIEKGGERDGVSKFTPGKGTARFVKTFDQDAVSRDILEGIVRGCK